MIFPQYPSKDAQNAPLEGLNFSFIIYATKGSMGLYPVFYISIVLTVFIINFAFITPIRYIDIADKK